MLLIFYRICDDYVILLVTFFVANQIILQNNLLVKKNFWLPDLAKIVR